MELKIEKMHLFMSIFRSLVGGFYEEYLISKYAWKLSHSNFLLKTDSFQNVDEDCLISL